MREILVHAAIMLAIGLMLALLGPFGSFGAPFGVRLLYWLLMSFAGYALYRPVLVVARRLAPPLGLPEAAVWAAACALATVPMTVIVWLADFLKARPQWRSIDAWVALYGYVLVVGGAVCALFWLLGARAAEPTGTAEQGIAERREPRLLARLPAHLRGDVLALEMEDHYVRVHTARGSALLLMRMRDAVAELDGAEGMQVHRSWWVARAAVEAARREGRNVRIRLRGEIEVPVARGQIAAAEAAGLI